MIKALTFDLDNTLIDFMKMKKAASNAAARAMVKAGLKMDAKAAESELFEEFTNDIEGDRIFSSFLDKKACTDERILAAALNAYVLTKYRYMRPYRGVVKTLKRLRRMGYRLAVVSDAPKLKAYLRLDSMDLVDYFDAVVCLDDTGKHKPDRLPFELALKKLDLRPEEVLHVGDWPQKDVMGAKSVGMKAAWAKYGSDSDLDGAEPDYILESFSDIIGLLKKQAS